MNILFSYKHKSDRDFSYKETQFKRIHEELSPIIQEIKINFSVREASIQI